MKSLSGVITDPPYYDAIAYGDISDFFYVWLKRTLGDVYPANFAYPQTPKTEECTALKHHHDGSEEKARNHFETKLLHIFETIEKQTNGIVSIMFAHQSTQAWTTLCNSVLNANMNITGSWAIDTEMGARMIAMNKAALASSVTVSCRPAKKSGTGDFKEIRAAVLERIKEEVRLLYRLGFRGADLLTACFGQAVSEFGKYERVEKADGTEVTVAELLTLARDGAFRAIVSDFEADEITKFYIGWLNLFGFTETNHDDVRRITQIGLNIDVPELLSNNILIRKGNKEGLATSGQRNSADKKLGEKSNSFTIDRVHKAMALYDSVNRSGLLDYIALYAADTGSIVWRVLHSMSEILPPETKDQKQVAGLLSNQKSLIKEAAERKQKLASQMELELE
jgi:adenine-specific DNA methylase